MGASAKKKKASEDSGSNLVMIMTISLFIILLAFFILLNAIATVDDKRVRAVLASLTESFNPFSGGVSIIEGKGERTAMPIVATPVSRPDLAKLFSEDAELSEDIRFEAGHRGDVASVPSRLLFAGGTARLLPSAGRILDRIADYMSKNTGDIDIVGHTDNTEVGVDPPMSSRELAAVRAGTVTGYLVNKKRLPPKRFAAFGWGEFRPRFPNDTRETRLLNRRIDFVFIHEPGAKKERTIFTFKDFFFRVAD